MMGGGATGGPPGLCPVVHDKGGSKRRPSGPVYNVYSQEIDPTNMMPSTAAQQPAPGQTAPLSVERVKSTITKGGTEGTWVYPSPQMFYNSLVRKGKAEGVETGDVDMVVAIHNEMNERTWGQLLQWEGRHKG
jgi:cytochrome c heme-lyase